eukprot:3776481-Amphidinium_carterae.1
MTLVIVTVRKVMQEKKSRIVTFLAGIIAMLYLFFVFSVGGCRIDLFWAFPFGLVAPTCKLSL